MTTVMMIIIHLTQMIPMMIAKFLLHYILTPNQTLMVIPAKSHSTDPTLVTPSIILLHQMIWENQELQEE